MKPPYRVLFTNWVDRANYNAQSLNAREIARRLDPEWFVSTLFYEQEPDPRLVGRRGVRLVKIPRRLGTATMLAEALRGQDIWFRLNLLRMTELYLLLPAFVRRHTLLVDWLEGHLDAVGSPAQLARLRRMQTHVNRRAAVTPYLAEMYRAAWGITSDAIIPEAVDTAFFIPPPARRNATVRVLFVGHWIERKNPHAVLLAARHFPQAHFTLVGAPRDAFGVKLLRLRDKWKLDNVEFHAPVAQPELRTLMHASDILFHPSRVEGIPKVMLEGGATGLPGVMFDHFQSTAVVNGVTGFQAHTWGEMLTGLGALIEDGALRERMGLAAVEHARGFDWAVIVRRWQEFLWETLSAGNGAS